MKIEQVEVFILSDRNTGARMDASFVDGLLSISLQNEIPEAKKPRRIHLNNGTAEGPQSLNE